jgi:hypothetical protein
MIRHITGFVYGRGQFFKGRKTGRSFGALAGVLLRKRTGLYKISVFFKFDKSKFFNLLA